jgi:aminobenzoyl-glutamate utilization protein B
VTKFRFRIPRHAALALCIAWTCPAQATPTPVDRQIILANLDHYAPRLRDTALAIWKYAELGFDERNSSARLQGELRTAGFTIEAGIAGMPTAFVAHYRTGAGPVIGLLAEFDALPDLSQVADPHKATEPGMVNGHACGHNLFGSASVAAAIAVRRWMDASGIKGEVRLYGTPAEEGGSGKIFMVRSGLMADVDAMLHWHPADTTGASQMRTLASISGKFRFHGIAAHAAMAPDKGRSALDGVEAFDVMVNMMREHVPQDARIHYVITNGGKAPNVVPDFAEVYYYVRHPDQAVARAIFDRVMAAAKGAAMGTGTTVEFVQTGGSFNVLPNDILGHVLYDNLASLPPITRTPQDRDFMTRMTTTLASPGPLPGDAIQPYSFGELAYVSSDVGDVSYVAPTAGLTTQTWAPGTSAHSWQAVAASGAPIGIEGAEQAAQALALSIADLFRHPDVMTTAKAELLQRRGPNFSYRSLLGDQPPALDYRKAGQ